MFTKYDIRKSQLVIEAEKAHRYDKVTEHEELQREEVRRKWIEGYAFGYASVMTGVTVGLVVGVIVSKRMRS